MKKILAALISVLMLLPLAACTGDTKSETSAETTVKANETTGAETADGFDTAASAGAFETDDTGDGERLE